MAWTSDSLLSYKIGSDVKYEEMTVKGGLADRWETPDAQTFTFKLHPGARYANLPPVSGRELSSSDIAWTYNYLARAGEFKEKKLAPSGAASMLAGLDAIETPDALTVVIRFRQPYSPFLRYAASQWLPIVAHEIYDADGDFSKRFVGTGPFQLDMASTQVGARWIYKKNPTYFQTGRPYLDEVYDLILPQQATQQAAFQTAQLDILDYTGLTLATSDQIRKTVPAAERDEHIQTQSYHLYMNLRKPPFDDARVRKAFALSIDRDEMIRTFADGRGGWALAAANTDLFTQEEVKKIIKFDPTQAKQLLIQAGKPNGADVELIYATSYGEQFASIAQLLQSQLKKGGINLSLKGIEHSLESSRRRSGDFQLGMTPRGQGLPLEPDSSLYGMFYPGSNDNQTGVNDPELTPLLEAQRREVDSAKRRELWRQAVRRINEVPWAAALFFSTGYELRQPYVENFARNISDESSARYLTDVWLAK
jgi:peptide/nickel transport system substrate-binding protein